MILALLLLAAGPDVEFQRLLELASNAWRARDSPTARHHLHTALRIDPRHDYANEFLATLYFLDGNSEAALKYWNRIGQPRLSAVDGIGNILLDRALAVAPRTVLTLETYRAARVRLEELRLFPAWRTGLEAEPDSDEFRLRLTTLQRGGWFNVASMFAGLPYQTLFPEFHNLSARGIFSTSLLRWDAQKRRALTELSLPLRTDPRWTLHARAGHWRETWNQGTPEDFRLNVTQLTGEARFRPNSRLRWRAGAMVSHRAYVNLDGPPAGTGLTPFTGVNVALLRVPERRLSLDGHAETAVGRVFSGERRLYSRTLGGMHLRWQPRRFQAAARARAGRLAGAAPFDELFQLGNDRDHDLRLRAHPAFRNGRKGRGLVGRSHVLFNHDLTAPVWRYGFLRIHAGPFLDIARMGSWHFGAGIQSRVEALPGVSVVLSYGWDLRTRRGAFFSDVPR